MKRLFVLFAFLLVSCAVFAQDEKPQSEGVLMIVPRLEVEPAHSFPDREWSVDLGTTSLYTYLDGNVGEHFSYSIANRWVTFNTFSNFMESTRQLYANTWSRNYSNWISWATVTGRYEGFFLTLGKDYIHFGTKEIDDYDHDAHWQLNSILWNYYQVFQWGGRFGWATEDEDTKFFVEITNDQPRMPHEEKLRPFSGRSFGDYAMNIYGMHDFENVTLSASISQCSLNWLGSLGLGVHFSDALSMQFDGYLSKVYGAATLNLTYSPGEHFDVFAKGGYDQWNTPTFGLDDVRGKRFYGGLGGYWYPLSDNHDLRIHALASYDGYDKSAYFSVGAIYLLNIKLY